MTTRKETLRLGNYAKDINVTPIPGEIASGFLYFNTNNDSDLKREGVRLIRDHLTKKYRHPFLIAPESSMTGIVSVLGYENHIPHYILGKQRRAGEEDMADFSYFAVTSVKSNTLFIPRKLDLTGYDVVIVDNVCTTGNTLQACYELLQKLDKPASPAEVVVLFTEGEKRDKLEVRPGVSLPITSFSHIPLYELAEFRELTQWEHVAWTPLPVDASDVVGQVQRYEVQFHVFKHKQLNKEAIAYYARSSLSDEDAVAKSEVVVDIRIHDACITSEVFHSLKCDCRHQLEAALRQLTVSGGMLIYLFQEGRGIGLIGKTLAYQQQVLKGLDTVQANRATNQPDDAREYTAARDILRHFGVKRVRLLTNNPRKVQCLTELGIQVTGTVPVAIKATSETMAAYQRAKAEQMGHKIPTDCFSSWNSATDSSAVRFYEPTEATWGFLSNFYAAPFHAQGVAWSTSEHYYQAQKFRTKATAFQAIAAAPTPAAAFELARKLESEGGVDPAWTSKKDAAMKRALVLKFSQNEPLYQRLKATGQRPIEEDSATDKYWGRLGENKLGKILQAVRAQSYEALKFSADMISEE